jgi:hypothetical protein
LSTTGLPQKQGRLRDLSRVKIDAVLVEQHDCVRGAWGSAAAAVEVRASQRELRIFRPKRRAARRLETKQKQKQT